ncbi:hypothetical protein [Limnohabitans sp.]|uniref:hypothetical protein n=1 Tax=Limnohabitans sp. TaxID=1907725 RepID=UPI0025B93ACB|nr:hypothetical protein [Limnohabitans sp.]
MSLKFAELARSIGAQLTDSGGNMKLRDFSWTVLGLLASVSVNSQQLRDARMLATEVDVSQEATLLLSLDKTSATVWCGLRVDFGNGRDQNLRVGERGETDLQMQVRYRYPTPGLYTLRVSGAALMRGLRSVVACEGGERSFLVRVTDRGAAHVPAALGAQLPPRGVSEYPALVQPPSPGPAYTPMQGTAQGVALPPPAMLPAPAAYPTAPTQPAAPAVQWVHGAGPGTPPSIPAQQSGQSVWAPYTPPGMPTMPQAPPDPGIGSPGPGPYPAAQSASPMPPPPVYGYAGAAPGAAGGQLMHDCGPNPDAACVAKTVAETVVKLREIFGKKKSGSSNTEAAMPYSSGGYVPPPPAVPPPPMNAGLFVDGVATRPNVPVALPANPAVAQVDATPQRQVPPGATLPWPAIPRGARTPIEGAFYVQRTYMTMGGGISLNHESYFFTSNGRFSNSPSGGVNLAALAAQPAASRYEGSYWIEGQELVMAWADGSKPWRSKYEGDARRIVIGSSFASRQSPFPRGWRLEGSYEGGSSIGGGTSSSSTIRFRRDGTFTRGSSVAIVSSTSRSDVTAGGSAAGGGTYEFDGFMLTLRENGAERKYTVFAFGERDAAGRPEHIFNQGLMMKRQ